MTRSDGYLGDPRLCACKSIQVRCFIQVTLRLGSVMQGTMVIGRVLEQVTRINNQANRDKSH